MTVYFTDSFESNDFSNWDATVTDGASVLSTPNTNPHSGARSAYYQVDIVGNRAACTKDLGLGINVLYVRAYYWLSNLPSLEDGHAELIRISDDGANVCYIGVRNRSGVVNWTLVGSDSSEALTTTPAPATGQWYSLELLRNLTTNHLEFWLNGSSLLTLNGTEGLATDNRYIYLGSMFSSGGTPPEGYFDDVKMADVYNGPFDAPFQGTVITCLWKV